MSDRVQSYAEAILAIVDAEGQSDEASDELFRFARTLEANDELRSTLVDERIPAERRIAVVEDLLAGRALHVTVAAIALVVAARRATDLVTIIDRFSSLAAAGRNREVAEVRSAIALDDATQQRLAAALSDAIGKQVDVKVVVDESVLGGVVARIGDTVIDGSVRRRLEQLNEKI